MAGDGLWGNTMFFFIAGLGVALSPKFLSQTARQWYSRRLIRVYPATLIATIILYHFIDGNIVYPESNWIRKYIWPTHFTFIGQIVLFYALGFLIVRLHPKKILSVGWPIVLSLPIIAMHIDANLSVPETENMSSAHLKNLSHLLTYFQTFLLGVWFALRKNKKTSLVKVAVIFAIILIVYLAVKLMVVHSVSGSRAYSALIPLSQILAFVTVLMLTHPHILHYVSNKKWIWKPLRIISKHTLELYIVHFYFVYNPTLLKLTSPLGIIAVFLFSLVGAIILKFITRVVIRLLRLQKIVAQI